MASAPEEKDAGAEVLQLQQQNEDYNPFTEEDIQKILHEEQNNSTEEGWSFVKRTEQCEIWRKNERDKPVHLIKGFLNFPGIPPEKVVEMIHDLEIRKEWDKQFPVIEVLEQHKYYRVVYWLVKMPPLVADRDLVQYIGQRREESTNTTYLLYRNATHPDRPERKGIVRAETILSGVIIRPDPENPGNSSKMSVLLQNDVKGWIPHFIVNAFAAKAPVEWHDSLANYYSQFYSRKDKTEEGDSRKDKTEEGDSRKDKTEEGDSTETGQSTGVAEGGESKGQSVDAEGGEGQVTSTDVPPTVETTAKVEDESADTAGGADEEQGEAPTKTEPVDEGAEKSAEEPPAESGPTEDEGTKPEVAAE